MLIIAISLLLVEIAYLPVYAWNQLPLLTESPEILSPGRLYVDIGVNYLQRRNFEFSGFSKTFHRNVLSCPALGLSLGLGKRVEVQAVYDLLFVEEEEFRIREVWKSGDLAFFTKIEFWGEQKILPHTGVKFGIKLPNAANQYRVGTDEADFIFSGLFQKTFSPFTATANIGVVILGDPFQYADQDDLLSYGFACSYLRNNRVRYTVELAGQTFGTAYNEVASALFHADIFDGNLIWKLSGRIGLLENSADWGLFGGVSIGTDILTRWASGQ